MIIPGRLRALVVDDNSYARAISGASLKKLGINDMVEADSGAEAILALMTAPFDFMLMDWYMPEVSGAGLMRVLRDTRFGAPRQTPVILMTGYASHANIALARELGVNQILPKPFTTEQLGIAVGRILRVPAVAAEGDTLWL